MFVRLPLRWVSVLVAMVVAAAASPAAAELKIYVQTDLEGISGVFKFTQTRDTDTQIAREAREYFMGDLAAVVRGLRDAGATEIFVYDGHGNQAVIPHLMEPGRQIRHRQAEEPHGRHRQVVRRHGHAGLPRDDGHDRRRVEPHPKLEKRKPLLV